MFTKLLKHEWRATRGVLGLLCLISLSAALVGGAAMRYLVWFGNQENQAGLEVVLCVLSMIAAIVGIFICAAGIEFFTIWRFYKSRFTDEGYLTFTLPVTTHQILLSSLVTNLIGAVVAIAALGVSFIVFCLVGFSALEGLFPMLWDMMPSIWEKLKLLLQQEEIRYVWMFLANALVGMVCEIVVVMLSVTIGSIIAQKHKILAAIGVYYGIHVGISLVSGTISILSNLPAMTGSSDPYRVFDNLLASQTALLLVIGVVSYILMYHFVNRKLNLN